MEKHPGNNGPGPSEREEHSRNQAAGAREKALGAREAGMDARELAASARELSLAEREELACLRDAALRAREEAREAAVERERLLVQMREANEKLVLATIQAHALADEANAARLEITESEERFRSLVTTSAAVVWQANAEGRISVDPESWSGFTGLNASTKEEEPGWGWLEAVHPDDRELVREAWTQATATHEVYTHQHRLLKRGGSYARVVSRAVPIPRTGKVREWIGMMTDISDRIRVEEAREQFIGILGHDLRIPLSAILMGVEFLLRANLPRHQVTTATRILRSARRMDAMIRDVLDFARGRLGGGIPLKREGCDLGRISAAQVDEMKQAHPGRTIRCETTGGLRGDWDPDRLEQALSNLIGNAVQHGVDPIRIIARNDDGDEVSLTVHNQGTPIPAAMIPSLFEPFGRRERGGSQGLGLGLYIVSEIVHAHGGTISVSSSESEGTMFTIKLPRCAPAVARVSSPRLESREPPAPSADMLP